MGTSSNRGDPNRLRISLYARIAGHIFERSCAKLSHASAQFKAKIVARNHVAVPSFTPC